MSFLISLSTICFVTLCGELLHAVIPVPIPASIYGLVLMLLALKFKIVPLATTKKAGDVILEIMPVLFIPAAVGILDVDDMLLSMLIPAIIGVTVITMVVMLVSGRVTQKIIERNGGEDNE